MPDWKHHLRNRLAGLHLEPCREAEIIDELSQHLADRYAELCAGGLAEAQSYQQTLQELDEMEELGGAPAFGAALPARYRTTACDLPVGGNRSSGSFFADLRRDLAYAARSLRHSLAFAFFVVLTLALGIGANTTVFTVVNTLLLHPIPVEKPSQLVAVSGLESKDSGRSARLLPLSYLNLNDLRARTLGASFSAFSAYTFVLPTTWMNGAAPERIFSELVTDGYFQTLGLTAARGRFFASSEDSTPGSAPVAVVNYGTWQTRFGGAPDIIGRTIRLNNVLFTVIGVAPKGFIGVNSVFGPDVWLPATMADHVAAQSMRHALDDRALASFHVVARLKDGVDRRAAQANVTAAVSALERDYPAVNQGHGASVQPVYDVLFGDTFGTMGRSPLVLASSVLLLVVGLVLLIACSNVANLLLARSAARKHEIAIRLALGASRSRLVRQLLTESVLLGLISGILGTAIGYAGCQLLWSNLPPDKTANLFHLKMDPTVFLYSLFVSLLTGFVFGMVPALRASRADVVGTLKEETRNVGRTRRSITLSGALLVGQVAFSFISLVTAALFLRSIQHAYDIQPGFETRKLALLMTAPGQAGFNQSQTREFYRQVRAQIETLPGVESVSWASNLPLWGAFASGLAIEGRQRHRSSDTITTVLNTVDLAYFHTAGVSIHSGRGFTEGDDAGSLPVAVVNQVLAQKYWPRESALGKRIQAPGENFYRQIIGIARNANYQNIGEPPQLCVYLPLRQHFNDSMTLYVRTKGDAEALLTPVSHALHQAAPTVVVSEVRTGSTIIDQALGFAKMGVQLLSVFGLLALLLASIGLCGLMLYSVNRRTREIGVRMALGAPQRSVVGLILRQGLMLVCLGLAFGLAASLLIGRVLSRLLYGVSATDPVSIAGAILALLMVSLFACYLPARHASRVDPLVALREG